MEKKIEITEFDTWATFYCDLCQEEGVDYRINVPVAKYKGVKDVIVPKFICKKCMNSVVDIIKETYKPKKSTKSK